MTKVLQRSGKRKISVKPHLQHHEVLYKNMDWAAETAAYYGFSPLSFPETTKIDREKARQVEKNDKETEKNYLPFFELSDRIAVLRDYVQKKLDKEPQPILISYSSTGSDKKTDKSKNRALFWDFPRFHANFYRLQRVKLRGKHDDVFCDSEHLFPD